MKREHFKRLKESHDHAADLHSQAHGSSLMLPSNDPMAALALSQSLSLLVIAGAQVGMLRELTLIRRTLQQSHSAATAHFNPTATLVPKDGGTPMPVPVINPSETQNVRAAIAPTNRAGEPTTGPFVWSASNDQLTLEASADGKSCLLITAAGPIDSVATVTDTISGNTETFPVARTVAPPPDNLTTAFNGSATLEDKPAA